MVHVDSIFNKLHCVVTFLNQLRTQTQPEHLQGMNKIMESFVKGTIHLLVQSWATIYL